MSNLDDLAKAAEEAEAANVHDRPVTDADLGETAAEGAQVVVEGDAPATPAMSAQQPAPEMQLPQPIATPEQPSPAEQAPVVTVQSPNAVPAPLPEGEKPPRLTPFNEQIMTDTASAPATPVMQVPQPSAPAPVQSMQPVSQQPMQPAQSIPEQPSAPPAAGTMPGQTVSPQTVTTPPSHIIAESYPHPTAGSDPLSGIAV
ncbi:MAG TPA: hypothetical protein VJ843_00890 [Candidatus Saccharimonadales bacterium]|nr:hypothetical protein [Candidatus Saccharimonadales bacterium]